MTFSQRSHRAICHLAGFWWAAALTFVTVPASAQTFPFFMQVQQGSSTTNITNQGTIVLSAPGVLQTATATLTLSNQSTAAVTISNGPILTQSGHDFTATSNPAIPVTLNPGDSVAVTLQFTASVSNSESALLTFGYSQGSLSGTVQLTLAGAPAAFTVSYTLPPNQNTVPLSAGGTVQFPATQINNSITATITITNTGLVAGTVTAVSIPAGGPFQIVGLGLLPATINPGVSLPFGVKYSPTQVATDTSTLTINIGGTVTSYTLSGSGINSSYSYTATAATGGPNPITPNSTVSFPDTALGNTASFFIQVRNVGSATGVINAINATGAFSITDGPTVFPVTMNPNDQLTFTLTFAPVQPGQVKGKLTVGNDVFDLAGNGLGPKLTFSYGPTNLSILTGGSVIFSPTQVGQTSQVSFTITNAGTSIANITSIAVEDTKGIFTVTNLPAGAVSLNPNGTLTFQLTFAPALTGFSGTVLHVDTQLFNLSGDGTPPPALPPFQFTGASGNVPPLQQPSIGLTLSSAYSLPLTGTLTISVNSAALTADPTIQFATGATTIAFTIPANTTQAVFPTSGNQIGLQVGTTVATITVTPTFATVSGLNLTPPSAPVLTLTVTPAVPKLLTIQITNVTQGAFAVSVTGLSTTHDLSTLTYQFTPAGGGKPVSYPIDVASASGLWFASAASHAFGGQFSVSVPFALPNPSTTALATSGISSVSVTANNAQGASSPVSLTLQ